MREQTEPSSLGQKTIHGAAWTGAARVGQQGIQTLSTVILARLLSPDMYGIMAMANFFVNLLQQVTDVGTGAAVIQREQLTERFKSSVFWLNVVIGSALAVIVLAISPLVAAFYKEPQVSRVMASLAITFLFAGMAVVPQSLLIREMDYKNLAVVEVGSAVAGMLVAILLAWRGAGVWSFVGAAWTSGIATVSLSFLLTRWIPSRVMSWEDLRSVVSFSLNLTGFVIVNYVSRNAGHFLVGRFLGPAALGYYQMAYTVMLYPLQNVTGILGRVMFPAFVKIQNDHTRFRNGYNRAVAVIGVITIPMMLGMMVVADELIVVFLGEKWRPVAALLVLFAPIGALQSVISPIGQIFMAKARTDLMLRLGAFSAFVQVAGYLAGMPWGLRAMIIGYGIANVIIAVPGLIIPLRLIEMRVREFLRALAFIILISLGMAVAAYAAREVIRKFTDVPVVVLSLTVGVGATVYGFLLIRCKLPVVQDLVKPLMSSRIGWLRRMADRACAGFHEVAG